MQQWSMDLNEGEIPVLCLKTQKAQIQQKCIKDLVD